MRAELITLKTAKLAKEKGFKNILFEDDLGGDVFPTQSLLQRWLREKHNIHIKIHSSNSDRFSYEIYKMIIRDAINETSKHLHNKISFNTYEEVLEEGLQKALKLIK